MKRLLFAAFCLIILFTSCKLKIESKTFYYQEEPGRVDFYNFSNKGKPLTIIIPSVHNSLFTPEYLTAFAKGKNVVVIYFLSHNKQTRLQQIDGLDNRLNYYSTVLNELDIKYNTPIKIVAEGVNANLALQLGFNFNKPELVLVNSWYPTLQEHFTSTCYSIQGNDCDSLLNYLSFINRTQLDNLLVGLKNNSTDMQYGSFLQSTWRDFINYNVDELLNKYPTKPRWIYTTNSGLLSTSEYNNLLKSNGKRNDVYLLSKKEFYKKTGVFSN